MKTRVNSAYDTNRCRMTYWVEFMAANVHGEVWEKWPRDMQPMTDKDAAILMARELSSGFQSMVIAEFNDGWQTCEAKI